MYMDISSIQGLVNMSVVAFCCLIGFVYKNYTTFKNKYIPIVMLIIGLITNICLEMSADNPVNFQVCVAGAVSGLASTGLYESVVNFFNLKDPNKKKEKNGDKPNDTEPKG